MRPVLIVTMIAALVAGCGGTSSSGVADQTRAPTTPTATQGPTSASPSKGPPPLGTYPPAWLGKRILPRTAGGYGEIRPTPPALRDRRFTLPDVLPELPGNRYAARVVRAPASVIARSTWRPGCPVAARDLDWIRLTFWGFDHRRHTGELLVNHEVSADLVDVFRTLYDARFPIEEMRITRRDELTAPPTGDGNDTGAFNCRPTVGASFFSQHAYGLAIDIDPFQNPYVNGDLVLPELASAYLDRGNRRPGMILPGDVVTRAFARIGWGWGGDFTKLKDLQHFSRNGR